MSYRKTVFALILAGAALPAAFASNGVNLDAGDRGFEFHAGESSTRTRADVRAELIASRQNRLLADGNTLGGRGDAGYTVPQHAYDFKDGKLVHADAFSHSTQKPATVLSRGEHNLYRGG